MTETPSTIDREARSDRAAALAASERDRPWLVLPVGAALVVYVTYLATHPYPAFGAGLFLRIAEEVAAAGYELPARISGYTPGGIPFAYPPLPFYVLAVLVDTLGLDPLAVSRYLPGVLVVAALPAYYFLAKELLGSAPKAGIATTVLAVAPTALRWHLSAGGVVRAIAFCFVAVGLYAGVRLFDSGDRRWLVPGAVAFGLTVLSHPIYTVYFGASYLVLFYFLDRSRRGLVHGAAVALGGFALASPWWLSVVATHGVDVFAGAAGTHDGLGGGLHRIGAAFLSPLVPDAETPFFLAVYAGMAYFLYRRAYLLPAWLVVAGYVVGKARFLFVPGSMMVAVLVVDWLLPRASAAAPGRLRDRAGPAVVALVVLLATGLGGLAAAGELAIWHGDPSQPAFVDDDDLAAMAWAAENTSPSARFVVLGDAAEWFPLVADRPILVGHWGAEWEGAGAYQRQLSLYREVSACGTERCVTATLSAAGVEPEYVYVPKGHYTIRGEANRAPPSLVDSMAVADRYERVYENEGVAVFRVVGDGETKTTETTETRKRRIRSRPSPQRSSSIGR